MRTPDCTARCAAMPECTTCHRSKKPRGRDAGIAAANGYCDSDCPGYYADPQAGHLWPNEWSEDAPRLRQWLGERKAPK